jgi:hypothetical protein
MELCNSRRRLKKVIGSLLSYEFPFLTLNDNENVIAVVLDDHDVTFSSFGLMTRSKSVFYGFC